MDDQHRAIRDEIAAYSLGALEPDEVDRIESHLAGCDQCREYLAWLDPAIDLLPVAVAQRRPPRGLKKALMADVREDVRAARRAEGRAKRSGRGFWGALWRPATAVVACVVLVAGVVGGYALRGDSGEAPRSVMIPAQGERLALGERAVATLEVAGDRGTLHVEELPSLPRNRVYQAWIQRDGTMEPSTPFVIKRDGSTEVAIAGSLDGASGIYITREPEGGSEVPTLPVVMKALL
ncbi:MAG: anti-sigma factor [Actinomycetota bacterium]|nr:anti-sigma factor [Actinomycetota bacterium]